MDQLGAPLEERVVGSVEGQMDPLAGHREDRRGVVVLVVQVLVVQALVVQALVVRASV